MTLVVVVVVVVVCLFVCFLSGLKMYQSRHNRTSAVTFNKLVVAGERTFLTLNKDFFKTGIWLVRIYDFDANIQPVVIGCCGRGDQNLAAVSACCFSMMDRENGTLRLSPCVKGRENICHPVWRTERTSVTLYERQRRHLSLTLCGGQRKHLSPCVKDRENTYHWPCVKDRTPITLCERQREHPLSCMTDRENTYHRVWKTERTLATTCMTDRENTHHRVGWTERALVTACMTTERTLPPVWRTERTPITVYDGQREH